MIIVWLLIAVAGVAAIVWGAETFAEHLAAASTRLGVSTFTLAVLLAGAEPEELATVIASSVRDAPAIGLGDVIGANVAICLVALGVGAVLAPLPFDARVRRYALAGVPAAVLVMRMPPTSCAQSSTTPEGPHDAGSACCGTPSVRVT